MVGTDEPRVYEIRVGGWTDADEILPWHEPVTRLLCPDPEHAPPCDVPWSVQHDDENDAPVLVVGVLTTGTKAGAIAERVDALFDQRHSTTLRGGDPAVFPELLEQYRAERGLTP